MKTKSVEAFEVGEGYRLSIPTILSGSSPMQLFFLFPKLKKFLSSRQYKSRQVLGEAVSQNLRGIFKSACRDAFQKWVQRLKLCISNNGEYFEGV